MAQNPSFPTSPTDTTAYRNAVTAAGIHTHLDKLQAIADANNGTRASGTPGYDASVEYVAGTLRTAGYDVTVQPFDFSLFTEIGPAQVERTAPTPRTYTAADVVTIRPATPRPTSTPRRSTSSATPLPTRRWCTPCRRRA